MLKVKLFLYEYVLAIFFLLQIILRRFLPTSVIIIAFTLLYIAKFKKEGFKITFPLFVLVQAALLYFSNTLIHLTVVGALYTILQLLPTYHCPEPTGPYKVGYKDLKIGNHVDLSIYYPTMETTKDFLVHETNVLTKRNYEGARLFFNIYIPYIVPQIIHEIAFSFFWKLYLGVNKDARVVELKNDSKFPVIVMSHGIACTKNLYTIFTKEWASRGYIVFCVDHDEDIYFDWKYYEDLVSSKVPLLKVRKDAVIKTLDYIEDESKVQELLGDHVQIDKDKVFMVGHSFGGGTAATVASQDNRITGGLLLLDPWMGPCDEKVFEKQLNLPILSIRSEEYDKISPIRDVALKYVESRPENIVSGYFKNSFHCSHCDLIIHLPKELCLWDMNGPLEEVESQITNHRKMINIFFDCIENSKNKKESKVLMKEIRKELGDFWATLDKKRDVFYLDN